MAVRMFVIFMLVFSGAAYAGAYKCEINGKTAYQSKPCTDGKQVILTKSRPTEAELDLGEQYSEHIRLSKFVVRKDKVGYFGDIWFSYKVTATNNSDKDEKVILTYNAVDKEGFYIDSVILSGTIPAKSYKTLTDSNRLKPDDYRKIYQWILDK